MRGICLVRSLVLVAAGICIWRSRRRPRCCEFDRAMSYFPRALSKSAHSMTSLASQISYLLDYTEWDRAQWEAWFRSESGGILGIDLGANADGRIANVGELVRHIFSAEQRYVDRIQELPITDTSVVPADDVDRLFDFGRQTRQRLRSLVDSFPAERWELPREVQIASHTRVVTPKTMLVQSVTHEIRHWAQLATLLRLAGRRTGAHDFLLSGVFERRLGSTSG